MRFTGEQRLAFLYWLFGLLGGRFRRRRMAHFVRSIQPAPGSSLLDVGGAVGTWEDMPPDRHVTIVNIAKPPEIHDSRYSFLEADGRKLPFEDGSFDIAFSNSVIEHTGTLVDQRCFASELRRVGRRYYLQTPARSFPIEPHYLTPFIHWLPKRVQRRVLRNFSFWGLVTRPKQELIDYMVESTRLMSRQELAAFFPGARIEPERALGFTKSWIVMGGDHRRA